MLLRPELKLYLKGKITLMFKNVFLFVFLASLFAVTNVSAQEALRCEAVNFEVTLDPSSSVVYNISGEMCTRGSVYGKTLQVLIHGASYDHTYWSEYPTPETSYVNTITNAGYVVLNIDRLGAGVSDYPPDAFSLSLHTHAWTVHQIVQQIHSGSMVLPTLGRIQVGSVMLVGFSLGSFISTIEASTYADVDGIILTSYSHTLGPAAIASFGLAYPANLDRFTWLPDGYLTTLPGVREFLFFYRPGTTDALIQLDEQVKGTYTVGEMADIYPSLGASANVHVPTLLVDGDYDMIACLAPNCSETGSLANEYQNYATDSCFEYNIIPDTGHTINMHNNAGMAFSVMRDWADRRIGSSWLSSASNPCTQE